VVVGDYLGKGDSWDLYQINAVMLHESFSTLNAEERCSEINNGFGSLHIHTEWCAVMCEIT
jgi:hypothetical protein